MTRTVIAGPYTFTGTDTTTVSTDSTNWAEQNGNNGILRIYSNHFRNNNSGQADCSWKGAGSFTDDQYFELALVGTWSVNDADNIGGTLRSNGAAFGSHTMYRVIWQPTLNSLNGAAQVYKVVTGTPTQLGANINFGMASGDLLSGEAVANGANVDIKVYKNGTLQGTRSDTSSVITGGKPGITGAVIGALLYGDDWVGGNITASSVDPGVITGSASTFGLPGLILS